MKKGNIVEITWMDASGMCSQERGEVENASPKDLLVTTKTYGIFFKEDDDAIMILQEDSKINVDYTVIPKSWITKIRKLK